MAFKIATILPKLSSAYFFFFGGGGGGGLEEGLTTRTGSLSDDSIGIRLRMYFRRSTP